MTYTTPVTTAFELQRKSIEQGTQAFEQGVELQQKWNEAVVDGLGTQESAQRRTVELGQTAVHNYLDAVEQTVPGTEGTLDEVREAVDEQYDLLLENHAEAFESMTTEYEEGADAYGELSADFLEALHEQIDMVLDAHEDLEADTVEAVEQLGDQVEQIQDQMEEVTDQVQDQVSDVQEQAVEAVEA